MLPRSLVPIVLGLLALVGAGVAPAGAARALDDDRGVVQRVGPRSVVLRTLDGTDVRIRVGAATRIYLNGRRSTLASVRPGYAARALHDGTRPARTLWVRRVRVRAAEPRPDTTERPASQPQAPPAEPAPPAPAEPKPTRYAWGRVERLADGELVLTRALHDPVTVAIDHETLFFVDGERVSPRAIEVGMFAVVTGVPDHPADRVDVYRDPPPRGRAAVQP